MTVSIGQIKWGGYKQYEGPAFFGNLHYRPTPPLDFLDKTMLIVSSTEGTAQSINMWDSCIMTVGIIQWCDGNGQFSVCDMLGKVVDACGIDYLNGVLGPALAKSNAVFKQGASGKWRFHLNGGATEVNTKDLQRQLYLSCSGEKGSWNDASKLHAKTWAACMASVWEDPRAYQAQVDFTKPKLMTFVFGEGKQLFKNPDETSWVGAIKSAYISFAVNSPGKAASSLGAGISHSKFTPWSDKWCFDLLHAMTFSGIGIWPARYNAIRGVLEIHYGIQLPKTAADLAKREWDSSSNVKPPERSVIVPPPPDPIPQAPLIPSDIGDNRELQEDTQADAPLKVTGFFNVLLDFVMKLFVRKQ